MTDFFSEARKSRIILGEISDVDRFNFTVYLGLFNAEKYIDSLISQLLSQTDQNFCLLVADNNSDDRTWQRIPEFLEKFQNRILAAKNPFNLGGGGGLSLNLDLIRTEWFCGLHQDDFYFPKHVEVLRKHIRSADRDVITVSADMGSMDEVSERIAIKPRANWVLKDMDRASAFISNLRSQIVPYPATAFRTNNFGEIFCSWHSTSFVDTEATLLMCNQGRFVFSNEMTMRYRENPMSESHLINNHESLFGTGVSLARVFSSSAFKEIAQSIDAGERKDFLKALNEAVENRLTESEFSKFIQLILAENCMIAWGYGESNSMIQVRTYFGEVGSNFTPELLTRILKYLGYDEEVNRNETNSSTHQFLNKFLGPSNLSVNERNIKFSKKKKTYDFLISKFPYFIQKKVGTLILKLRIRLNPKHPWNFKWKKNR